MDLVLQKKLIELSLKAAEECKGVDFQAVRDIFLKQASRLQVELDKVQKSNKASKKTKKVTKNAKYH